MSAVEKLTLLEESLNRMTSTYADALRVAVDDFDGELISVSSVDRFRARVLAIADQLAKPVSAVTPSAYGDGLLGRMAGVPEPPPARHDPDRTLSHNRLDRAMGIRNESVEQRRLK